MRLEYFQLIDRIVELKLADRKISTEATVPTASTIFEGHFPGYPLMPGVLLIEAMAQTSGWLVVALNRFERMPFLAAVKEAKLRTFVKPGERLSIDAQSGARRLRLRRHRRPTIKSDGKLVCDADADVARARFPQRRHGQTNARNRRADRIELRGAGRWLRPSAKPGSPASASSPRSAKVRRRIGRN